MFDFLVPNMTHDEELQNMYYYIRNLEKIFGILFFFKTFPES
eukprot:UN00756